MRRRQKGKLIYKRKTILTAASFCFIDAVTILTKCDIQLIRPVCYAQDLSNAQTENRATTLRLQFCLQTNTHSNTFQTDNVTMIVCFTQLLLLLKLHTLCQRYVLRCAYKACISETSNKQYRNVCIKYFVNSVLLLLLSTITQRTAHVANSSLLPPTCVIEVT